MTRAEVARSLLDKGWSPIPAHEAVTQGTIPDGELEEPGLIDELEAISRSHG